MSLWSEMRARSNGETIRKDDMILDKEQLATVVKSFGIPSGLFRVVIKRKTPAGYP